MQTYIYSDDLDLRSLLGRNVEPGEQVRANVLEIIDAVKQEGDSALKRFTKEFDRAELDDLKVSQEEIKEAYSLIDQDLIPVYQEAANNIQDFHEKQKQESWEIKKDNGIHIGQKITPIEEVGVYVPGGKAAYPSTVLMNVIPAKIAGVSRIVMVSPPGSDGKIDPHILVAADIAGVDEIYKLGGAQAVAALTYGTETIEPVSKIVGPGNIYVATAKKEVFGTVDIDMIAGPSEVLVFVDKDSDPKRAAADLLAQAEHDQLAMPVLVSLDKDVAQAVEEEVKEQITSDISRKAIAQESVQNQGRIFITRSEDEAIELINEIAPEHLELLVSNYEEVLPKIKNAGAIFLGAYTPEPVGDYFAGPNHTLPTSGTAKFSSPLGVYDFEKRSSVLYYPKEALESIGDKVIAFAESEGLDAHAQAIRKRLDKDES